MNSTMIIGGMIKDYRIRKRLSQFDVSLRLGWKDSTKLSKIEQGRSTKPQREVIDKLLDALGLEDYEKGDFLYNAGYLPSDQETKKALGLIREKIDNWEYPAYLMDFSWRLLYSNIPNLLAINFGPQAQEYVNTSKTNILEYALMDRNQFPAIVEKGEDENHLLPFAVAQIASFKTENHRFQNEGWYRDLVNKLMKNEKFKELWPVVSQKDYQKKLQNYEFKRSTFVKNGKKVVLNFHMYTAKIIGCPQLEIVFYHPADEKTKNFFNSKKV